MTGAKMFEILRQNIEAMPISDDGKISIHDLLPALEKTAQDIEDAESRK